MSCTHLVLLLLLISVVHVLSVPAINLDLCKSGDDSCITNAVRAAYPMILEPNPSIGADELDPMFNEAIDGNLSTLKYTLFNTTILGFKSCAVESTKYREEKDTLLVVLMCPNFSLQGLYDIDGRLIVLPIQGKGDYFIETKKFKLDVTMELKNVDKDGQTYKNIKNFKVAADAQEPIRFEFNNLFNGNKELADTVIRFANENWKEVVQFVQGPVFESNVKKIVRNANKYLKTIPINQFNVL